MHWFFGYGSLIWKPGFPFETRIPARLPNHARRFWQGSPDHRGVPENPGRVVTLTPMSGTHCRGVVFGVEDKDHQAVIEYLDVRESGGYERTIQSVELEDGRSVQAVVYVGRPDNPSYLGPASNEAIAEHIASSQGPSGTNIEYLLKLRDALHELDIDDEHIEDIVAQLPERSMA